MLEGDHGKLAAPAKSQWTSAEDAEDVVAAVLGAVEAGVGALPAAVDGVGAIGVRPERPQRPPGNRQGICHTVCKINLVKWKGRVRQ